MSKFMEVETVTGSKVLINIDKIIDVYCLEDGNAEITLGLFSDSEYSYEVENYEKIKEMIKIKEMPK